MTVFVLGVDPGKTSGIAVVAWHTPTTPPILERSFEANEEDYAEEIADFLGNFPRDGGLYVACESFVINMQTVRNSQAPYSLEQIGVLKHLCRKYDYPVEDIAFQSPVNAKNMFPNPALKKLGTWHRGGKDHANDAVRHALLRLVKAGWKPVELIT